MSASRLGEPELEDALARLPGWTRDGDRIARTIKAQGFRAAQALVNRICDVAEGANHHPTIDWTYATIRIELSTHDAGGLTQRDIALASLIDTMVP